jgi:tRNA(Ile)-lysidine synthase
VREKVLRYIRERGLMRAGDRVCAAVSGGADSVALLRVLLELRAELGIVLSVAHFNHGLRGEASDADQQFVAELAKEHELEFFVGQADVRDHAILSKQTLEAASRELRYRWLSLLATSKKLDAIATGHTLDDQAETVLMKFLRGAGTRGLAGVYPQVALGVQPPDPWLGDSVTPEGVPFENQRHRIVRPLLDVARAEVESYLTMLGQSWREDETNRDARFTRNRVRHELLPLLERDYNPNLRQVLSETAEIARAEEEYWQELATRELAARCGQPTSHSMRLKGFSGLPLAVRRRVLRAFVGAAGCTADFEHIQNLVRCALGEIDSVALPGDWLARRHGDCLHLSNRSDLRSSSSAVDGYIYSLQVPGGVHIDEISTTVQAWILSPAVAGKADPGTLLAAAALPPELTIRNWRPGDRYWPAHSKSEEKLKRLFSEKKIPEAERAAWPVALAGEEIVWVRGFPVARQYEWRGIGDAVRVAETASKGSFSQHSSVDCV